MVVTLHNYSYSYRTFCVTYQYSLGNKCLATANLLIYNALKTT
jgi:hypothetical protein